MSLGGYSGCGAHARAHMRAHETGACRVRRAQRSAHPRASEPSNSFCVGAGCLALLHFLFALLNHTGCNVGPHDELYTAYQTDGSTVEDLIKTLDSLLFLLFCFVGRCCDERWQVVGRAGMPVAHRTCCTRPPPHQLACVAACGARRVDETASPCCDERVAAAALPTMRDEPTLLHHATRAAAVAFLVDSTLHIVWQVRAQYSAAAPAGSRARNWRADTCCVTRLDAQRQKTQRSVCCMRSTIVLH